MLSFALTALIFSANTSVVAQEMKEAVDLYNGAAQTFKKDPAKALEDFTKCISICDQLDTDESKELRGRAEKLLPRTHFEIGRKLYGQSKVKETIASMEKARDLAEQLGDKSTLNQVNRTVPQIYYKEGITLAQEKDFAGAVDMFSRAIKSNARYMEPIIAKAIALDSLRNYDEMLNTLEDGIQAARNCNNIAREMDMKVMALNYLKPKGFEEQQANKIDEAIETYIHATRIDGRDAEVYQALAIAYQSKSLHDSVIVNADRALEVAGGTMDLAQIYFLKAQALQANGDTQGACEAYREAAHGQFKEKAEHEMKNVLKCN